MSRWSHPSLRFLTVATVAIAALMIGCASPQALRDPALAEHNLPRSGLAVQGFDVVAYHTEGRAIEGTEAVSSRYRGAKYLFASEENRARFNEDPETYLPTYGGWCATAMAEGEKVAIDPRNFKVTGGRLFLFYDGIWGDAKEPWDKDEENLTREADRRWNELTGAGLH